MRKLFEDRYEFLFGQARFWIWLYFYLDYDKYILEQPCYYIYQLSQRRIKTRPWLVGWVLPISILNKLGSLPWSKLIAANVAGKIILIELPPLNTYLFLFKLVHVLKSEEKSYSILFTGGNSMS